MSKETQPSADFYTEMVSYQVLTYGRFHAIIIPLFPENGLIAMVTACPVVIGIIMEIILMRHCPNPVDNYPYSADTFNLIKRLASTINRFSRQYNVPPIAVAGAIADEYNTRIFPRNVIDWFQDEMLVNWMPSSFIALDARTGFNSKWSNITKHDIGIGNIKLETAKKVYERHKNRFGKQIDNWGDLVDYIRTDAGTIHIATLVIKRAQFLFSPYVKNYPLELKEAVFVTYYKQGPTYLARFRSKSSHERNKGITPGEGCRVYHQRDEFKKALGAK